MYSQVDIIAERSKKGIKGLEEVQTKAPESKEILMTMGKVIAHNRSFKR